MNKSQKAFAEFKAKFDALCLKFGGEFSQKHCIYDNDSAYLLMTPYGKLKALICQNDGHKICGSFLGTIYMQFKDYSGPQPFPLHGDFNRYSHKWNIHVSGSPLSACNDAAVLELENRLELLAAIKSRLQSVS